MKVNFVRLFREARERGNEIMKKLTVHFEHCLLQLKYNSSQEVVHGRMLGLNRALKHHYKRVDEKVEFTLIPAIYLLRKDSITRFSWERIFGRSMAKIASEFSVLESRN